MPYKDPKKRARFHRAYYRKHQQDLLEYGRRYHKKHYKRYVVQQKKWRRENPEKYRAQLRAQTRRTLRKKQTAVRQELRNQKFVCGLCREKFTRKDPPVRDHCHRTGKRRALLHNNCNFALGHLKDSPKLCTMAAKYLRKW